MKTKLLLTLFCTISIVFLFAQNSSTGDLYGARATGNTQSVVAEKPVPNPVTMGVMDIGEGFDDITTLAGNGWAMVNNSNPIGTSGWFQGNSDVFPAFDGAANAYIGANFNNTAGDGTISNWLITPEQAIHNGDLISFYTRGTTSNLYPDRLQLRFSASGSSTNVGTTETSVGDFTNLLLDINPTYTIGGYPDAWAQFSVTVSGLGSPVSGRFAFRYFVENGGPYGDNSNYIGIDRVAFTGTPNVPVSDWAILIGIVLIISLLFIRYRRLS